jgi:hypothetical protein
MLPNPPGSPITEAAAKLAISDKAGPTVRTNPQPDSAERLERSGRC